MKKTQKIKPEFFIYLAFTLLLLATARFPFFWDTIQLASKHAGFFYDNDFRSIILPNEIDSGHIPTLGIYIAAIWKIFGRSLFVSHIAMLPFVLGIVWQAIRLIKKYIPEKWHLAALIILLLDPTLLAQCTLVSPDVLLVFFFMMALNHISEKNRVSYAIALAGLTLSSMRGMMCVAGLFCAEIIIRLYNERGLLNIRNTLMTFSRILIPYLPALLIAGLFLGWHFYKTGWIGYHRDMPWYTLFESVDFKGAVRNIFILGWRLIDFGRFFVWITALTCLRHFFRNRPSMPTSSVPLSIILVTVFLALGHAVILHRNLSGHRYLLPVYIVFTILVIQYLYNITGENFPRKFFTWLLIIGLLTGNFWVYPDRIAKGWDSTLAYLPFFPLREKMMTFMENEGIKLEDTGSSFPNTGVIDRMDLSGNMRSFAEIDLLNNNYIFYSNVFNNFSNEELDILRYQWIKIKEFRLIQVKVTLYKNPRGSFR
ncbi:MAG: hypothetical protein MUC93_09420 [Bacteroidales bacterium]|nr:hypothetical protein [Bacteroidales bacterium]